MFTTMPYPPSIRKPATMNQTTLPRSPFLITASPATSRVAAAIKINQATIVILTTLPFALFAKSLAIQTMPYMSSNYQATRKEDKKSPDYYRASAFLFLPLQGGGQEGDG